mmetsp:Transcript_21529/g.24484  ORF Transcript_21529/g.24484 Transcript_21529/m.24484 type:complete len:301 (+) Transcript_21529:166-1068(+)
MLRVISKTKRREKGLLVISFVSFLMFLLQSRTEELEFNRNLATESNLRLNALYRTDYGCISRDHKLAYVHIPKTGGTTMEYTYLFDDAKKHHPVGGHHEVGIMMNDAENRGVQDFVTAAHVRHPCERFISAFNYLSSGAGNKGDKVYAERNIGDMNIEEFVMKQEEDGWICKHWIHFFDQHRFAFKNEQCGIDEFLCQEQWDEGINRLYHRIDVAVPEYLLQSADSTSGKSHALHLEHKTCADLSEQTRLAIQKAYAIDYCVFEYNELPPPPGEGTCVGTGKRRHDFTERFSLCKTVNIF